MKQFKIASKSLRFIRSIREIFDEEYTEKAQEYQEQLELAEELNLPFTDSAFPPDSNSLSKLALPSNWQSLKWRRAGEIFPSSSYQIFSGPIEPQDIRQGILGDCYFLCALSVIAEKSELVKRLFHNADVNKFGIYSLWLNINGEWVSIVIDDYFPCSANNQPAFSRANGPELWVMLLEKAYAKVYGSYFNIEGGNPAIAMRDLTGAPYENKEGGTAEELWEYCEFNYQEGFLLTAYTKEAELVNHENELGLLAGHAYAILKLATVLDCHQQQCQILQMRNPWGRVEWKGDWSDNSNKWTTETKYKFSIEDSDDGVFWMSIQDFRRFFAGIGVCKIKNDYIYNSIQCQLDSNNCAIIHIEISDDSHIYISFNQNDDRFHLTQISNYRYSFARIIVAELKSSQLTYVTGIYRADRNIAVETTLKAGQYLAFIELQWQYSQIEACSTLSTYAQKRVRLRRVTGVEYMNSLKTIIKDYSDHHLDKLKEINYLEQYHKNIFKRIGIVDGYLFLHYQNLTFDSVLQENIYFHDIIGYKPVEPLQHITTDGSLQISFTLPPQSTAIILLSQVRSSNGKCQYTQKSQSQIVELPQNPNQYDNLYLLKEINLGNMQSIGRHKLNVKSYSTSKKTKNQSFKIFQNERETIELSKFETGTFYYFNDFLSEFWEPFIFSLILLSFLFSLMLALHRTNLFSISILTIYSTQILSQQKFKKSLITSLSHAQLFQVFIEIVTRVIGFESTYFSLPTDSVGGFLKLLIIVSILVDFLTYISILKFVVHYETIETEVINPMNQRFTRYLNKLQP